MAPAHSVAELLNAAQDSRGEVAWARCAGQLWKLILQDPDPHNDELLECVNLLLTVSQKSPRVQHIIKFYGSFASKAPEHSEIASAVMEGLLEHLARHTTAADKDVRFHACQLLHQLLTQLPASVLSDDAVLDTLTEALTERLSDKLPAIRAEAVRGLCSLISFFEDAQDIVDSVEALLGGDKSKDVRMAVVLSLPLDTDTLPVLLRRARDVSPQVRKALAVRLGELSVKVLSIQQRASILQHLLQDRDTSVAEAGRSMLAHWLEQHCGGDPLQLLQYLDVETYTDAAVCALESLINSNRLHVPGQQHASDSQPSAIAYVKAATAGDSGAGLVGLRSLCSKDGQLLEPQEALLWRCLCEWLQSDAISRGLAAAATAGARAAVQAAVAAERHEVLEAALPESADDLMGLIMRHTAAGPPARFAAAQLLTIAAKCMEWADVASRDSAAPFLQQLVALDPNRESDSTHMDLDSSAEDDEAPGLQLAGNSGDGMFEAAVVQLVAAMQGSTDGFMAAMLDGIADLAAAAGLLRKPASDVDDGAGQQQWTFTVGAADTSQVLQVLCYIRMLLQRLPIRQQSLAGSSTCSISFESLWELLLLLALKHDNTLVRAKALECIGLYAVVAAGSNPGLLTAAVSLLGPLLAAEGSDLVRAAAVRALADIALLYGPAAVDAVLRRPSAGAAGALGQDTASGDGEDGAEDGSSGGGGNSSCKGLLELLIGQGQALLTEAQAGASKPARKVGRPSTKSKAVTDESVLSVPAAELMAVVAEALAKLLLHQRAWLRHYPSYVPPANAHPANTADAAAAQPVQLPADSQQQQARLLQSALALLLQLQFQPATANSLTEVCQRLSVFFDVFGAASEANQLQLAAACLPAARQALHLKTKKHPAPLLAKYVLQLLQQARLRREQAITDGAASRQGTAVSLLGESFTSVAHMLLEEVTTVWPFTVGAGKQPALYKPYLSSLLKAVFELPIESDPQCIAVLQNLTHTLSVLVSSSKDPTLAKDLTALQQHLQALADAAGGAPDTLSEDSLQQLVQQYRKLSLEQLPALPDELAEAAGAAAAGGDAVSTASTGRGAGRGGRTRSSSAAVKAPAGRGSGRGRPSAAARRAAAAAASSDDDSSSAAESDDDAGDDSSDSDADVVAPAAAAAAASAGRAAGRRSSAAAAGGSRRRSAAVAAASDSDSSGASEEEEEEDSEEFATADESGGDEAGPSSGHAASSAAAAAAERAAGAGAVGEMSDSDANSDVDSDADSFCSDQEEAVRAAVGKHGVQVGKGAVAGSAAAHRQPLAPSAVVNRR